MTQGAHDPVEDYLRRLDAATADLPAQVREDLRTDVRTHLEEARHRAATPAALLGALDRLGPPEAIADEARGGGRPTAPAWPPPAAGTAVTAGHSAVGAATERRPPTAARDGWTVVALLLAPVGLGAAAWLATVPLAAAGVLIVGSPVIVLGVLAGVMVSWALLWTSASWSAAEKLLGTLVWPGGYLTPLVVSSTATSVCTQSVEVGHGGAVVSEQVCSGFSLPLWAGIPAALVLWIAPLLVAAWLLHRTARRRAATP